MALVYIRSGVARQLRRSVVLLCRPVAWPLASISCPWAGGAPLMLHKHFYNKPRLFKHEIIWNIVLKSKCNESVIVLVAQYFAHGRRPANLLIRQNLQKMKKILLSVTYLLFTLSDVILAASRDMVEYDRSVT